MTSKFWIVLAILICTIFQVDAQTTRYWSLNFASEPSILAGAVVGGNAENQAIYYNPAVIHENEVDNISFSGEIISLDFYNADNAFGTGFDLKNFQFNVLPSYLSFYFKSKKNKRWSFQLALLTRDKNDFDVTESITGTRDIYPSIPGVEGFSNFYSTIVRYNDVWIGGGASFKISDKLSVGMSSFISVKSLDNKLTKSINIIPDYNSLQSSDPDAIYQYANARQISSYKVNSYNLQTKIGLQYRTGQWSLGMNVTLPSFQIYGTGKIYGEFGTNNIYDGINETLIDDFLAVGSGQELDVRYQDPLSIAIGVNHSSNQGKDMLGVSLEYFHEIAPYRMIDATDVPVFIAPNINSQSDLLSVWNGARSLVNVAVGYRKFINPRLTLLGGVRTDFDYLKNYTLVEDDQVSIRNLDYYTDVMHLTLGARFSVSRHRFIAGIQYSFGQEDKQRQLADFIPDIILDGIDLPVENLDEVPVTFTYNGLAIFFGFIFNFEQKQEIPD